MSETSQSRTAKRWREEFSRSKLDSWISTNNKRARWFFRTTPSDSDNSLDTGNCSNQNDNFCSEKPREQQLNQGTSDTRRERQGNQRSIKPRVITVPTIRRKNLMETIPETSPLDRHGDTAVQSRKVSPAETQVVVRPTSAIPYEGVTISSKISMMQDGPACPYEPTCYAITAPQTRCPLPLENQSSHFCRFHSKIQPIHGTLLDTSIFKGRDQWYTGKLGTTQCRALSHRGLRCKNTSVAKWDLCRVHLKSSPQLFVTVSQRLPNSSSPTSLQSEARTNSKQVSNDESELSSNESRFARKNRGLQHVGARNSRTYNIQTRSSSISDNSFSSSSSSSSSSHRVFGCKDNETSSTSPASSRESSSLSSHSSSSESTTPSSSSATPSEDPFWEEPTEFDHSNDMLFSEISNQARCCYISSNGIECPFRTSKHRNSVYCHGHYVLTPRLEYLLRARKDYIPPESTDSDAASLSEASEEEDNYSNNGHAKKYPVNHKFSEEARPYTHREFLKMWKKCEEFVGESTDDIESTRYVRGANKSLSPEDTDGQTKAQYGRLLPRAMKTMMKKILCLDRKDVFLDIGHGLGNTCLQAAFTAGCEARGIEVVFSRNSIAGVFRDNMMIQHRQKQPSSRRIIGEVHLRHGRLEDDVHRDFLTKGVTRAYVNNFNGVFADRSSKNNGVWFLDDYVAGLFALMAPGAIMVTLHPLNLGPTQEEANCIRRKHDLWESCNASFFSVEQVLLGKACDTVKWNQHSGNSKDMFVYKYTRLHQDAGPHSVFMCCNPVCELAKIGTPISATTTNEEGRYVINQCRCKFTAKNLRRQRKTRYA